MEIARLDGDGSLEFDGESRQITYGTESVSVERVLDWDAAGRLDWTSDSWRLWAYSWAGRTPHAEPEGVPSTPETSPPTADTTSREAEPGPIQGRMAARWIAAIALGIAALLGLALVVTMLPRSGGDSGPVGGGGPRAEGSASEDITEPAGDAMMVKPADRLREALADEGLDVTDLAVSSGTATIVVQPDFADAENLIYQSATDAVVALRAALLDGAVRRVVYVVRRAPSAGQQECLRLTFDRSRCAGIDLKRLEDESYSDPGLVFRAATSYSIDEGVWRELPAEIRLPRTGSGD